MAAVESRIPEPPGRGGPVPVKWYTVPQVAKMLGYSVSKTKTLVVSGRLRSIKDGGSRRVLPEWVDEYIARRVSEADE